jgi:hypothetical protein
VATGSHCRTVVDLQLAIKETLLQLGLVAHTNHRSDPPSVSAQMKRFPQPRKWPSYRRCTEAPTTYDGTRPDTSRADFTWCLIAIDWGWSVQATAARLMEESTKARENCERYAHLTAQRAAAAVDHRRGSRAYLGATIVGKEKPKFEVDA